MKEKLKDIKNAYNQYTSEAKKGKEEKQNKKKQDKKTNDISEKVDKEINKFKKVESHQMTLKNTNYKAQVSLWLKHGTIEEEIAVLGAEIGYKDDQPVLRVRNREDEIVFEEPKPDQMSYFNYSSEEVVDDNIEECKSAIEQIQSGQETEVKDMYLSDWQEKLRYWQSIKTHLTLGENGSFMRIRNGVPTYEFELAGLFKIPKYDYVSTNTIAIPPMDKVMTGFNIMEKLKNDISSSQYDAQKMINSIMTILLIVGFLALVYFIFQSGSIEQQMSENLAAATQDLQFVLNQSSEINEIQNTLDNINQSIANEDKLIDKGEGEVVE